MPTLTQKLIASLTPKEGYYEVRDDRVPGFLIRVAPTGRMVYVCQFARGKRYTIGDMRLFTIEEARNKARLIVADYAAGIDPLATLRQTEVKGKTLLQFLQDEYQSHMTTHHTRKDAVERIGKAFPEILNQPLSEITFDKISDAISKRVAAGKKPGTVNKETALLKAALQHAVDKSILAVNPSMKVKLQKIDKKGIVRYLKPSEKERLFEVLDSKYANNRLKPMTIVSLNTGIRFGELVCLRWRHVDFDEAMLTVEGNSAKSRQTRYVNLNAAAVKALKEWRSTFTELKQVHLVFPGKDVNTPLDNVDKSWKSALKAADIENFRWHDLRHSFASSLAQQGTSLQVIQALLGHSTPVLTQRYAHLAPNQAKEAVATI